MAIWNAGRSRTFVVGLVLAALGLASCTHTSAPHLNHHRQLPPPRSTAPTRSGQASLISRCRAHADRRGRVVTFRGARSNSSYCAIIWTADVIHDCAKYAYGPKVIAFLKRHHCGTATRTLASVFHAHFAVNLSSVATAFAGTAGNPLGAEFRFAQLAKARGRGGINDLLRDGRAIPGPRGEPSKSALYGVYTLNTNVDILYGWYRRKPSPGYGTSLKLIEQDIAFTPATS